MGELSVSERDFCNWVRLRSGHIHTLNKPYQFVWKRIKTTSSAESWSCKVFGPHQSAIAVFTPAQKIHIKGGNELEFDSI